MKITFINRNLSAGFSVKRAFGPIIAITPNSEEVEVPYSGTGLKNIIFNLIYTYRHRNKDGINHITGDIHYCIMALPSKKTVLTVLDAVSLVYNDMTPIKRMIFKFLWFYLPLKRASAITCISDKTKDELIKLFPWCRDKVYTVYVPINEGFSFSAHEFNKKKPVILHIGTKENKNLNRVIQALRGIRCHLRIIGKLPDNTISLLKENKIDYSNIFNVSDDQILQEYKNCDIVSFPSLYEGFGMPVIEGFSVGRVVVTSDIEPMRTLSEGAAILANPYEIWSIQDCFMKVINDDEYRNSLITKGLSVAKRFTPQEIYNSYQEIYNNI